jgi:hypothetical protein
MLPLKRNLFFKIPTSHAHKPDNKNPVSRMGKDR